MDITESLKVLGRSRRKRGDGTRRNVTYQRYNKPPYSYLGMIAMAIETAPQRRLTLGGIHNALKEMFPFFNGQYLGWRDSVRHNLSHNHCFYKVSRETRTTLHPKGNYWKVDLAKVSEEAFQRQSTKNACKEKWSKTLQEQLGFPPISLDPLSESKPDIKEGPEEPVEPCQVKKGVKNFKIDTILQTDTIHNTVVKEEKESGSCIKDTSSQSGLHGQNKECSGSHYFIPSLVFRDHPHLAAMLKDASRQCEGKKNAAIENLRSLCPPANYGTPPTHQRTWATQPVSPLMLSTSDFPLPLNHGVNFEQIVEGTSEPMDLSRTDMEGYGFAIPQNENPDTYFGHNEATACRLSKYETASPLQHTTANSRNHPLSYSSFPSQFSKLGSSVSCVYYDESVNQPMRAVPPQPTYLRDDIGYIPATSSQQSPHYALSTTNSYQPPHYAMMSPMSVTLEDSRSSSTSATCPSTTSSAAAVSPVSSFASLQDMISDTASQMSDDMYIYHEPNGMFMRSVENSSDIGITPNSSTVSNTQNLDMLAKWALSYNKKNVPETVVQPQL